MQSVIDRESRQPAPDTRPVVLTGFGEALVLVGRLRRQLEALPASDRDRVRFELCDLIAK